MVVMVKEGKKKRRGGMGVLLLTVGTVISVGLGVILWVLWGREG